MYCYVIGDVMCRREVSRCSRGVQASARDAEMARLTAVLAAAEAAAEEERARRSHADTQLQAERAARLAAIAELDRNSQRLLDLAGAGNSYIFYNVLLFPARLIINRIQ